MEDNYFGLKKAIVILIILSVLQFLGGLFITAAAMLINKNLNITLIAGFVNIIVFGSYIYYLASRDGADLFNFYSIKRFRTIYLFPGLLLILGISILVSEFDNILRTVLPLHEIFLLENLISTNGSFFDILVEILTLCIVAPLTEELIFRGLILERLNRTISSPKAIFWSAFLFGLFHLNPLQFPGAFIYGCIFGYLFILSGSVLPGIILHAAVNFLPVLLIDIIGVSINGYIPTSETLHQPVWFNALGIILSLFGILLFFMLKRKKAPDFF